MYQQFLDTWIDWCGPVEWPSRSFPTLFLSLWTLKIVSSKHRRYKSPQGMYHQCHQKHNFKCQCRFISSGKCVVNNFQNNGYYNII